MKRGRGGGRKEERTKRVEDKEKKVKLLEVNGIGNKRVS